MSTGDYTDYNGVTRDTVEIVAQTILRIDYGKAAVAEPGDAAEPEGEGAPVSSTASAQWLDAEHHMMGDVSGPQQGDLMTYFPSRLKEATLRSPCFAVLGLVLMFGRTATAQYSPTATASLGAGYGSLSLMIGNLSLSNSNLRTGHPSANVLSRQSTASALSSMSLFYEPSPQGRKLANAELVAFLTRNATAENKQKFTKAIESGELLNQFDALLVQHQLSDHNLADASTLYLVIAWGVLHDTDAMANTAGIESLRHGIHTLFTQRPEVIGMPDAQKQNLAETLGVLAVLALRAQANSTAHHDAAALGELHRSVQDVASIAFGLDLTQAKFTEKGLVAP